MLTKIKQFVDNLSIIVCQRIPQVQIKELFFFFFFFLNLRVFQDADTDNSNSLNKDQFENAIFGTKKSHIGVIQYTSLLLEHLEGKCFYRHSIFYFFIRLLTLEKLKNYLRCMLNQTTFNNFIQRPSKILLPFFCVCVKEREVLNSLIGTFVERGETLHLITTFQFFLGGGGGMRRKKWKFTFIFTGKLFLI